MGRGKIFKINEKMSIVCDWIDTRYGFKHEARLFVNGYEAEKAKCCYHNRTWERFEYETVVLKLINQTDRLTEEEKTRFKESFSPRRVR